MENLTFGQQLGLNASTSAVNGLVGGAFGLAQSALQHKHNKDLADYQYDKNVEMWNMQNKYNSPIAQRQRLEQAGLNPALMYGGGSVSTGNANSSPQYQQNPVDIIGAMQNAMLTDMQIKQMSANIDKTEAETEGIKTTNQFIAEKERAIIDNTLSQTGVNGALVKKYEKEIQKMDVEIDSTMTSIDVMLEEINLKKAQSDSIKEQAELTKLQRVTESLQQGLIKAQTTLTGAQTMKTEQDAITSASQAYLNDALAVQAEANTGLINANEVYQSARNAYKEQYGVFPDAQGDAFLLQLLTSEYGADGTGKALNWQRAQRGAQVARDVGLGIAGFFKTAETRKNEKFNKGTRKDGKDQKKIKTALKVAGAILKAKK